MWMLLKFWFIMDHPSLNLAVVAFHLPCCDIHPTAHFGVIASRCRQRLDHASRVGKWPYLRLHIHICVSTSIHCIGGLLWLNWIENRRHYVPWLYELPAVGQINKLWMKINLSSWTFVFQIQTQPMGSKEKTIQRCVYANQIHRWAWVSPVARRFCWAYSRYPMFGWLILITISARCI